MLLSSKWFGPALLAVPLFASTNADDLVLLTIFYSQRNARPAQILLGQLAGLGALTIASIVAARLAVQLPDTWIPLLGLVPIALGLRQIFSSDNDDDASGPPPAAVTWWAVATVTIANGSDNLGVYIPVFAVQSVAGLVAICLVFIVLTFCWCGLASGMVRHPRWGDTVRRAANRFGPYILVGVGLWILSDHPWIQARLFG